MIILGGNYKTIRLTLSEITHMHLEGSEADMGKWLDDILAKQGLLNADLYLVRDTNGDFIVIGRVPTRLEQFIIKVKQIWERFKQWMK